MHHFGIELEAHMRQEELLREAQERRQVRGELVSELYWNDAKILAAVPDASVVAKTRAVGLP